MHVVYRLLHSSSAELEPLPTVHTVHLVRLDITDDNLCIHLRLMEEVDTSAVDRME